jgi:hypothetical protein
VKRSIIAAVLLLACLAFAGAGEVDVAIRYFDKRVYYAGSDGGPVLVQVTIANHGASTYRFKLADERIFSVDFEVRTISNRLIEPTEILTRKRTQDQPVFFREIAVEPGESLSFTENLRDYAMLDSAGSYVVLVRLYPELYRPEGSPSAPTRVPPPPLTSNRLALSLRPAPLAEDGITVAALDVETGAILARESMPPDQVVEYILTARQKGQWEKFFLYLDLEAMLTRNASRKRTWLAESEEGRLRMLERYRADLRSSIVDGDIATIPIEFTVERTNYGAEEGTVSVIEKFRYGNYVERKRYIYNLKRRDDVWTIFDYTVINLGTE